MQKQGNTHLRVMVIDDNATMRSILRYQLNQLGIEDITEATNGSNALKTLADSRIEIPDLILCDLHMDGMDGMQFCNTLRTDKTLPAAGVPIIIVTADKDQLTHEVACQVGAKSVLAKPFTVDELQNHLEDAIGFQIGALVA